VSAQPKIVDRQLPSDGYDATRQILIADFSSLASRSHSLFTSHPLVPPTTLTVGNKIDESAELREVSNAEGQAQAAEWGVHFMETSAKTNHNVTELFEVSERQR
jgi:50S ribosomal subunit-associated GTPase HflX